MAHIYIYGTHRAGTLHMPRNYPLENSNSSMPYKLYLPQSQVGEVQSIAEPQHNIHQVAHAHLDRMFQESNPPYVPEDTCLSVNGTYGRYLSLMPYA